MKRAIVLLTTMLLALAALACDWPGLTGGTTAENPSPVIIGGSEATVVVAETESPAEEEPSPIEPEVPLPALENNLSPTGPWLVFEEPEGLAAVNADGTGRTLLLPRPAPEWSFRFSAAPAGGHIGVYLYDETRVTMAYGENDYNPPYGSFWVISLPDGTAYQIVEEALPSGPPIEWSESSMPWDFFTASDFGPWTSDGGSALITSAHEGSVDVYRLDAGSMQLTRISESPAMAFRPRWSPDERYIVWDEIWTFGTGAGYSVNGLWAAPADGSAAPAMLEGSNFGGDYIFLGWRNNAEFAFTVFDVMCGEGGAWLGNVETGQVQAVMDTLFTECVLSIDYSPVLDDFLFIVGGFGLPDSTLETGLYHLAMDGGTEYLAPLSDDYHQVMWSEAAGTYLLRFDVGEFERYPLSGVVPPRLIGWPESLTRSPDGQWLAISAYRVGGILVGTTLEDMAEIYATSGDIVWTPDSTGLFVATAEGLILVDRATGAATPVAQTAAETALDWAYP
jgi:hypothetical protein